MPCAPKTRWDQALLTCNHESTTPCVTGNYVNTDGSCANTTANTTVTTADCADEVHDCIYWAANKDCICKWTDGDCSWQTHVAKTCPKTCGLCPKITEYEARYG